MDLARPEVIIAGGKPAVKRPHISESRVHPRAGDLPFPSYFVLLPSDKFLQSFYLRLFPRHSLRVQ